MGQQSDSTYFMRRASEEQAAAERADDPRARQAHCDLAERYCEVAEKDPVDGSEDEPQAATPLLQPEFRILR